VGSFKVAVTVFFVITLAFLFFFIKSEKESILASSLAEIFRSRNSRPLIVAFGDSFSAGLGVAPGQSYPDRLQRKLDARAYPYRVLNAGISGETSLQALRRVASICELQPQIVIVEFGANDPAHGFLPEDTRHNLSAIVSTLQNTGAEVILAGMEPTKGMNSGTRDLYSDLAHKHGIRWIPFFLAGVEGHPELNQEDARHPTARGYEQIARNVWNVLKPVLQESQTARQARSYQGFRFSLGRHGKTPVQPLPQSRSADQDQ
jgi:acyl-CoA thioesterase I